MRKFLRNTYQALSSVTNHLWFVAWFIFFVGVALSISANETKIIPTLAGFLFGFAILTGLLFMIFQVTLEDYFAYPNEDEEEALERQFVMLCDGALEAMPEDRRDEFHRRLIKSCDYYGGKSLREVLDEWWWKVNIGTKKPK